MDDIRAILDGLDGPKLAYVYARSRANTRIEAIRESGMSKSAFYEIPAEEQTRLDELADKLRHNRILLAEPKLNEAVEKAVDVLIALLSAKSEYVQLQAAQTVIERVMGKVKEQVDVTSGGEPIAILRTQMPLDEL